MIKDVLYFGELGFFMHILGAIEYYLTKHPDIELSICTYKTFYEILKILFGSRIQLWDIVPLHSKRAFHNCKYYDNNIQDIVTYKERLKTSNTLIHILKLNTFLRKKSISYAANKGHCWLRITKTITYKTKFLEQKYKNKNIILFFFRNRTVDGFRNYNLDIETYIDKTINYFNKINNKTYEPILWGVESNTSSNASSISDIKEFIYLCNICFLFVSCDSGLLDLALHANVKNYSIIEKKRQDRINKCNINLFNYKLFDSKIIDEDIFLKS